jgi:ABC-type dipeptide/oligopeptide/nickel transport system permease subunit
VTLAEPATSGAIETGGVGPTSDVADLTAARPLRSEVWTRFRQNRLAVVGLGFLVLIVLLALFAPVISSHITHMYFTDRSHEYRQGPSGSHWFGTDSIGRDVFIRVLYGARVSLRIGVLATVIQLAIGLVLGSVAGYFSGALDSLLMRVTDIFFAIPYVVLAVAIATVVGRSENSVILIIALTAWPGIARIVRSSYLSLKQLEYVEAATALGFSRLRIMYRHILPNALQPIIIYGTITVGAVILTEAALSFLGVGPQPPTPAWGLMVAEGKGDLVSAPHLLFFPGGAICLTVLALVFIGDGLRDALDPKLK